MPLSGFLNYFLACYEKRALVGFITGRMLFVTTFDFVWNSVLCIDDNWGFQTQLSDVSSPGNVGHLIVRTLALRKSTH